MKRSRLASAFLVILFISFQGCASLDDYLEVSLDKEPKVIFSTDIVRGEGDRLIILAVSDASVMKRLKTVTLGIYLENSGSLAVIDERQDLQSKYLQFSPLLFEGYDAVIEEFGQLRGFDLFALVLRDMSVDQDRVSSLSKLGDGEFRFLSPRSASLLEDRGIQFITKEISGSSADLYRGLADCSYRPE